jgi:hypothetical protein
VVAERSDRPEHVAGVERRDRRGVVEIHPGGGQGFSASSISITGMSSRTG